MTIFDATKCALEKAINNQDYDKVLYYYDNKGLLSEAAKQLDYQNQSLQAFIGRALRSDSSSEIHAAIVKYLPTITTRP